jgi:predicted RND superfamily exporter protein
MNRSFFSRWRFTITLVILFLGPLIWRGTRMALRSNRNDVRDWLPAHFTQTADYRWFQEHFPHEQFVLCSWEGCTLSGNEDDPRLELLAKKLVPGPVSSPVAGTETPPTAVAADVSGQSLKPAPAEQGPKEPRYFKKVITGPRLVKELQERYPSLSRQEILDRLKGSLIGPDYDKTCLVVTLTEEAQGKNLRPMIEKIRELARQCDIEPPLPEDHRNLLVKAWDGIIGTIREMIFGQDPPGKGIRMGGPPVDNVAIDVEGERTLMRLASLSAILGLGISMACFRSWRLTAMVFWIALLAAGIGLASVYWTGRSVDAVMLSMPSLVYVLAISGAIHIINYYHDAIRETGLDLAPERALEHGWLPCTMAAVTTAIGLGSLYRSHVIPISKFGIYSAIGVMATLALLFLVLPAMLSYFPSRKFAEEHGGQGELDPSAMAISRYWQTVGGFIVRNNLAVAAVCFLVMVLFALGLGQIKTSVKLMKFFSPDAEIIHHYAWLEENLGPLVPMEVVLKFDNEKCKLNMLDRMRLAQQVDDVIEAKLDAVGGALSAATFAPDLRPDRRRASGFGGLLGIDPARERDYVLNKRLEEHRREFRDYLTVDADATLDQLGISGQLAARLAGKDLDTLDKIERYCAHGSIADKLTPIGIDPEDAARVDEAARAWESAHGQELWRVSARVDALSDLDYAVFVDDLKAVVEPVLEAKRKELGFRSDEGIVAVYTGVVPLVYQTQHELMRGLFNSLTMAFVLITFVMMFMVKSVPAGLVAMLPNIFPVIIIFGAMGLSGILVDVGTMMTASVALGVAVDDTMHYLTWFRRGLDEGLDRKEAAMMAYGRCGTAMTQTTLIGGLGLAAFAFSTFTPTQRFGTLMLLLLFVALVGDLIFLPALLTGPLGRVFVAPRKKSPAASPSANPHDSQEAGQEKIKAGQRPEEDAAEPVAPQAATPHWRRDKPHHERRAT